VETAWHRSLDRLRSGGAPEDDLDRAIAGVLPRGDISAVPEDAARLVLGSQSIGDAEALPDEALIGWAAGGDGDADAPGGEVRGYDRLILDLLEAGFRIVRERACGESAPFRVLRARRDGYRIRSFRPGDELAILKLFRDSFGEDLRLDRWRWRYVDNPRGGPRISLAFAPDGRLVGQYCAYPVRWRGLPPSAPAEGHQVGDTMTRRGARGVGRGPTSILARTSRHFYLVHCNGRVAFNYGFNTGNITKFSTRYVGAHVVEDAPNRVLPKEAPLGGRPRFGRGYELRRITERFGIGPEFDALFDRVADRYGLLVERSAEYLRWRYLDCPDDGLELVAADIADHPENQTRFVAVAPNRVPNPTGQDKTSIVVFQHSDRSGSLMGILAEFAARSINLTKLESRPTKKALGDYCFLIDLEGHIGDSLVADCLTSIVAKHGEVKFLGAYPATRPSQEQRQSAASAFADAREWVDGLRRQIGGA